MTQALFDAQTALITASGAFFGGEQTRLLAACYPSVEAFTAAHGVPEHWEKREISIDEIQAIFAPPEPEVVP